ncbi:MAG: SGNH/GDSL hydrolase family protein [Firmicutes bacterium HGW-Firmicutes-7]|nr:MAG: SGNH/GDSL hydrolase family protein [Firmicutes bacterium HGW-Firmicutes-7]
MGKSLSIGLFGDSILKGVQINPVNKRYHVDNHIDIEMLSKSYSMQIKNYSYMGCTVTKGKKLIEKRLETNIECDAIIMDYGGNDCDYNWNAISENPKMTHLPNTPIELFKETYYSIINMLKGKGILPIMTTLPPLEPRRFFEWFCRDLNKANILEFLGNVNKIYDHQESYSRIIEEIAHETHVPLIDLRESFLKAGNIGELLCEDGTHPNTLGQKVITSSLNDFAYRFMLH